MIRGMLWVDSLADRGFWGILAARGIDEEPVDRAAGVEIAENAIPTQAWTAHRTRRPQRPTGVLGLTKTKKTRKDNAGHNPRRGTQEDPLQSVASLR